MCPVNTVRNVEFINYQAISKCLCEQRTSSFLRNVEGLKCLLTNDLKRRSFSMNWLVIQLLKKQGCFKDFTTVVQKFKVLDLKFFLQISFNECEETLSELTNMYESDPEKELKSIHSRLTVCLPDSLDLDRCLWILFWLSACE